MGIITYVILDVKIPVSKVKAFFDSRETLRLKSKAALEEVHQYYRVHQPLTHPDAKQLLEKTWIDEFEQIDLDFNGRLFFKESTTGDDGRSEMNNAFSFGEFCKWLLQFRPKGYIEGHGDAIDDHWLVKFNGDGKTIKSFHYDWKPDK